MSNVNVKIGADSSQFNRAMRQMAQELKATESELNLASEQARLFGTNSEYLSAQVDLLTARLEGQNAMLASQREYIATLSAEQTELAEAQATVASTLEELNVERQQAIAEYGLESEEVEALDATILELNAEYATLGSNLGRVESKLNSATVKMNNTESSMLRTQASLNGVNKALVTDKLDRFSEGMGKVSDSSGRVASALTPVSLGLVAVGGYAGYASVKFSDALAKLATIADTSQVSIASFKQQILALSNQTGESATAIAESAYQAISAGVKTGDTMQFVAKATTLAKAGFTSTTNSVDILTTILNAYGLKASEVGNISNDLIRTQNLGKTTVDQLAHSMGQVIPIAKESGVNLQQLCSAYVELTQKGIDTAESTTLIKSMLSELSKTGSKSDKALKKLTGEGFQELIKKGYTVSDVLNLLNGYAQKNGLSLKDMFANVRAGTGALVLASNGGKDFNNILKQMSKQGNDTNEAFQKISSTTGFKLRQSLTQLQNSAIKLGDSLQPLIVRIANGLSKIATAINKLTPAQLKMIENAGLMVIGFTGVMKVISSVTKSISLFGGGISKCIGFFLKGENEMSKFGKTLEVLKGGLGFVTKAFSLLWKAMTFNTVTIVITALVALGVALVEAYNHVTWFRNAVNTAWKFITNVFNTFLNFLKGIFKPLWTSAITNLKQPLDNFLSACGSLWNEIKSIFSSFISFLGGTFKGQFSSIFSDVKGIIKALEPVFSAIFSVIKGLLSAFISFLGGVFCAEFKGAFNIAVTVIKTFLQVATTVINTIKGVIQGLAEFVSGVFTGNWSGAWHGIVQIFSSVFGGIKGIASSIMNGVGGIVKDAFGVIKDIVGSIFNAFSKVASVASSVGSKVSGALGFATVPTQDHLAKPRGFMNFASMPNKPTALSKGGLGFASLSDNLNSLTNLATEIDGFGLAGVQSNDNSLDINNLVNSLGQTISNSIDKALSKHNNDNRVVNVPVYLNGKQIALASSNQLDRINGQRINMQNRQRGM